MKKHWRDVSFELTINRAKETLNGTIVDYNTLGDAVEFFDKDDNIVAMITYEEFDDKFFVDIPSKDGYAVWDMQV